MLWSFTFAKAERKLDDLLDQFRCEVHRPPEICALRFHPQPSQRLESIRRRDVVGGRM